MIGSVLVLMGKVSLSLKLILAVAAVILIADVVVFRFAVRIFQRETILTRWK